MNRYKHTAMTLIAATAFVFASTAAKADKDREYTLSWGLCGAATQAIENEVNLPRKLLKAISIAESGRHDSLNKVNVAWPWTVTSGSQEWYLDSKDEAVAHVRTMLRSGVRNIDVGCMQINLRYHGKNFKNLEQVFDPLRNVGYAATFLTRLRKSTNDWMTAVGNYHSTTPQFHNRYRKRVAEIWKSERRRRNDTNSSYAMQSYYSSSYDVANLQPVPIDRSRTEQLNEVFRNRATQSVTNGVGGSGGIGSMGGDNWKTTYMQAVSTGESYILQAQVNRIRKAAEEQQRINDMITDEANRKSQKHRSDLNQWRKMNGISLEQD